MGTKCVGTKCVDTKCVGTKCVGTKCTHPCTNIPDIFARLTGLEVLYSVFFRLKKTAKIKKYLHIDRIG